jgi:hypothetical protein
MSWVFLKSLNGWFSVKHLFLWSNSPTRASAASLLRFLHHKKLHTTVGRTPLDGESARRKDLYLTAHNNATLGNKTEQERECKHNVTLKRIHETTIAVEKQ